MKLLASLEQFQEKWIPVFRPELRKIKRSGRAGVSGKSRYALIATAALLLPLAASAEEPDLTGTWTAVSGVIRTTGGEDLIIGETSTVVFTIENQNGPVLSGT